MFFVRVFDQYGFMVQMVGLTLIDVAPFISFILMFMIYFALVNMILNLKMDADGEIYTQLSEATTFVI